jgi:hypothetical protein
MKIRNTCMEERDVDKNSCKGARQWYTSVVPATREAKTARLLEPRSCKPVWATLRDPISKKDVLSQKKMYYPKKRCIIIYKMILIFHFVNSHKKQIFQVIIFFIIMK